MNEEKISNSIYISSAFFQCLVICYLGANSSIAYYHGIIWIFPIILISIPIYRSIKHTFRGGK